MSVTDLMVRRLLIDLETPFARHWCGGDAFLSALLDALSMSFPIGEQFFIDAVKSGLKALSPELQEAFRAEVQGFTGQEATHRRVHSLFNRHLERQGLVNEWEPRAAARLALLEGADPRHALAITAANEHFTAILAEWMLGTPELFAGSEPRLRTLWLWHSSEESEHRSTAFDVYQATGGSHAWRVAWFRRVTLIFLGDTVRQTVANLKRDGELWRWRTWMSAARWLLGKRGLARATLKPWYAYFRRDFHPRQQESGLARRWLQENAAAYSVVGSGAC
jgi:predicted metal-dependent hydrolase